MIVSDLDPNTVQDELGLISGICDICKRNNAKLAHYRFNEPKQIVNWSSDIVVKDNPNALQIAICGTDMNLVARIKREIKNLSPRQIVEKARKYRIMHPIKA